MRRLAAAAAAVFCLAAVLAPLPADAAPCDRLTVAPTLALKPFVLSQQMRITARPGACSGTAATFQFLDPANRPVAEAELQSGPDRTDIRFRFLAAVPGANFGVEATSKGFELDLLDVTGTKLRPNGKAEATTRYPYDWTEAQQRAVRDAESIIPGVKAGGLYIVYDTPKLGALVATMDPGSFRILFPVFHGYNAMGDKARGTADMTAGAAEAMRIYHHAGLAHIQDQRFGAPARKAMAGAEIAQFVPKAWAPSPGVIARNAFIAAPEQALCGQPERGKGRPCFPTADELTAFAVAMPPARSIVLARLALPTPEAARAIRRGGASPHYYMFLGALSYRDADPAFRPEWRLIDSAGKPHMAPYSDKSDGHWMFLDLTQKPARDFFVGRALEALDAGYEGIFMDGGFLWNMPNGLVGGDNPKAALSQYEARHILLRELRQAMRARRPDARLGILANRFAEYMHYADYVSREGTSLQWDRGQQPLHERVITYDPAGRATAGWQSRYGRLIVQPVILACKGPSAVLVRSCRQTIGAPQAGFYYDSGDWHIHDSEIAAAMLSEIYGPGDLFVTRVEDDALVQGHGMSAIGLKGARARLWFSRAVPLIRTRDWSPTPEISHTYQLQAGETYIPADRAGPNGWTWARQGAFYRSDRAYVAGDFYHLTPPAAAPGVGVVALLGPSPRIDLAADSPRGAHEATPQDSMTLHIALSGDLRYILTDQAGRARTPDAFERRDGRAVLSFNGPAPVVLTIVGPD